MQEKVRYVFLAMNGGGYRPAPAEVTWQRRFGDCKGKTVLLLALLHELGIEAVPVLVSTDEGDGLDGRLPAAGWFDHAIVLFCRNRRPVPMHRQRAAPGRFLPSGVTMAEGVGFEPTVDLHPRQFSRLLP